VVPPTAPVAPGVKSRRFPASSLTVNLKLFRFDIKIKNKN
jgi:hypothetical protein